MGFCEIDPFCRKVLAKHWPGMWIHDDIKTLTAQLVRERCGHIDVICGGFPCQDISMAGNKAGIDGERSGLWRELFKIIRDIRPRYAIVENVPALLARGFERVIGDLASIGLSAEWDCIPASAVGAHYIGDRMWIVASSSAAGCLRWERGWAAAVGTNKWGGDQFERLVRMEVEHGIPAGSLGRISDGLPNRMDRLSGLGNSVNPQIVEAIGNAILVAEMAKENA